MKRNWLKIVLIYCLILASLPRPAFAAVPVATSFSVTASTVGNKPITLQGNDPDNTPLTFALLSNPSHGAISNFNASTGALIYTPAFGYTGADSFTFRVTSGGQDSSTATVSITVTADKTRVIDYVTDAGRVGRRGTVTFILTTTATSGGGLISPASSVSAVTDATGKYDLSIIPSANLNPKTYYQVYFQTNYSDRRLLGIYDIPVSATPIALQTYRVTDTNLANRFTFADKASVDAVQTSNANAVFQSLVPLVATDGQVFSYDATTQRLRTSPIRDTPTRLQLDKPVGAINADSVSAPSVSGTTGNFTGTVTAQNIVGNGAGITGLTGATGGVNNTGSTTVGADSNQDGIGVIDETVGNVTVKRTHADRVQLFKPLELTEATVAQIAAMPEQGIARASDGNRGLYIQRDGRAVSLNGRVFDITFFGGGSARTATQNSTAIALAMAACAASGGGMILIPESISIDSTILFTANNICIAGAGRGTVVTLTVNSTAISYNGYDYCEIRDLSLFGAAGGLGVHFSQISHHNLVRNVYFKGFSDAGMRFERSFYANVISCEFEHCNLGVDLKGEANGNYFLGNNLRECRVGYMIRDAVVVSGLNVPSNENSIVGGLIEASSATLSAYPGQQTACVEIAGAYLNKFIGVRMENTLASNDDDHTQIRITSGADNMARENSFIECPIKGGDRAFVIGNPSGTDKVFGTLLFFGRGYYGKVNASAVGTVIRGAQGTYYGLVDNGTGSDVDVGPGTDEAYVKPINSASKAYSRLVGIGTTDYSYFGNAVRTGFTDAPSAFTQKAVDIGGSKVPVFQIGAWRLWVDDSGRLRIQGSDPTSLTGGTIVGTQN